MSENKARKKLIRRMTENIRGLIRRMTENIRGLTWRMIEYPGIPPAQSLASARRLAEAGLRLISVNDCWLAENESLTPAQSLAGAEDWRRRAFA